MAALVAIGAASMLQNRPQAMGPAASAAQPRSRPLPPGAQLIHEGALVEWRSEEKPEAVYVAGDLTLRLSSRQSPDGAAPVLTVEAADGASIQATGEVGLDQPAAAFGVGPLDPSNPVPQVLFESYSGGAHCCVVVKVLEFISGGWREIDAGAWDGDRVDFPTDVDGDGWPEFEMVDNRFLYAFGSYAASRAPRLFLQLRGGRIVDVTAESRYRPILERDLPALQQECTGHSNPACAAFVATAARLGRGERAWPLMLSAYVADDWTLPSACRTDQQPCPQEDQVRFATFPESLRWFLGDIGYMPPISLPQKEPGAGPSFDCTRVTSVNLRLVCSDPALSAADRELSRVYTRAMALSPDMDQVRAEERAFVLQRNNAAADRSYLLSLYEERIGELKVLVGER